MEVVDNQIGHPKGRGSHCDIENGLSSRRHLNPFHPFNDSSAPTKSVKPFTTPSLLTPPRSSFAVFLVSSDRPQSAMLCSEYLFGALPIFRLPHSMWPVDVRPRCYRLLVGKRKNTARAAKGGLASQAGPKTVER